MSVEHMQVSELLINAWAAILTLILSMYVILDGFDLGVGILSLLKRDATRRNDMMNSLSGVWDANETWLVLLGGVLFGAFPLAYAAVLQALYLPILLMLFALVFRGVAFEYRLYASRPAVWLFAFGMGSLMTALAQGLVLGGLLGGLPLGGSGTPLDLFAWATPFSFLTAALLVTTYSVFGACYLVGKVAGALRDTAYRWAWRSALLLIALLPVFLMFSARAMPYLAQRWAGYPLWYGLLALAVALPFGMLLWSLKQRRDDAPFFWCLLGLVMAMLGLVGCHYPFLVPVRMTLHMAASSSKTLEFMLYAMGGLLPLILAYNGYQYYVFRGRLSAESGY